MKHIALLLRFVFVLLSYPVLAQTNEEARIRWLSVSNASSYRITLERKTIPPSPPYTNYVTTNLYLLKSFWPKEDFIARVWSLFDPKRVTNNGVVMTNWTAADGPGTPVSYTYYKGSDPDASFYIPQTSTDLVEWETVDAVGMIIIQGKETNRFVRLKKSP